MALVDYSSSSDEITQPTLKRKRSSQTPSQLPPLPPAFYDLYAATARTSTQDDPSLHGGRKRAVPHVQGNWPSHIYLEWLPSSAENKTLQSLLDVIKEKDELNESKLNTLLTSTLDTPLPLHISLSVPLSVSTEDKDSFLDSLRKNLPKVGKFTVKTSDLHVVANGEGTRWFFVLRAEKPEGDQLNRLLKWSNVICSEYGSNELYTEKGPSRNAERKTKNNGDRGSKAQTQAEEHDWSEKFHFSIAWSLQPTILSNEIMAEEDLRKALMDIRRVDIGFESVKVKIGNVVTSLSLEERPKSDKGILG